MGILPQFILITTDALLLFHGIAHMTIYRQDRSLYAKPHSKASSRTPVAAQPVTRA